MQWPADTKTYIVTDVIMHKKLIAIVNDLKLESLIYSNKSIVSWETDDMFDFSIMADNNKQVLQKHIFTL